MNPRIQELRAKSVIPIQKDGYTSWVFSEDKFAELIVRECAAMADFADKNPGDYVLKHFGVEE